MSSNTHRQKHKHLLFLIFAAGCYHLKHSAAVLSTYITFYYWCAWRHLPRLKDKSYCCTLCCDLKSHDNESLTARDTTALQWLSALHQLNVVFPVETFQHQIDRTIMMADGTNNTFPQCFLCVLLIRMEGKWALEVESFTITMHHLHRCERV